MARLRAAARNRETDRARWVPPDRREPPGTEPGDYGEGVVAQDATAGRGASSGWFALAESR
jgi:hypothetical protein